MDKIAVLIPCYNERLTIGKVVRDIFDALPETKVYVYNNNRRLDSPLPSEDAVDFWGGEGVLAAEDTPGM